MLRVFADGRIFADSYGDGTPRVLALHGWRRSRDDFAQVLAGFDALAVDLPGFGASPPPPAAWGSADYADALVAVVDAMAKPIVLVGHSFGGRVALQLAAAHPEPIAGVVLAGVPLLRLRPPPPPSAAFRVARALNRWHLLSDARMEARRRRSGSDDYRAASGVMRDVFVRLVNESYEEELRSIRCTVELVWGRDDAVAPVGLAERAAELLARPSLTVIPGAGHLTPITAPAELHAAISRLLPVG